MGGWDFLYFKHSGDLIWEEGELLLSEPPSIVCISGGIAQNPLNSPQRSIHSLCQEGILDPSHTWHHLQHHRVQRAQNPPGIGGNAGAFGADAVATATAEQPIQPRREECRSRTERQESAPRDAGLPKIDDFFLQESREEGGNHDPPSPTPGQGALCPARDAQAESSGKIPSFSNPPGKS